MFFFVHVTNICNFADDNSLYTSGKSLDDVISKLNIDTSNVVEWFRLNSMVANPEKFQAMFLGVTHSNNISIEINGNIIYASNSVKLLGILIDHKLSFTSHIEGICKQASQKTKALLRVRRFLTFDKASMLVHAYVLSSFFYCPILWMFCSKTCYQLINKVHRRALSTLYFRFDLDLTDLLQLNGSFSIHTRHLQVLLMEVFKSINKLNPEFNMWKLFENRTTLRSIIKH